MIPPQNFRAGGKLIDAESMAASINNDADTGLVMENVGHGFNFHFTAPSATHVGECQVMLSNDGENWWQFWWLGDAAALTDNYAAASGSALNAMIDVPTRARYAKPRYVASSGAGALTCVGTRLS